MITQRQVLLMTALYVAYDGDFQVSPGLQARLDAFRDSVESEIDEIPDIDNDTLLSALLDAVEAL